MNKEEIEKTKVWEVYNNEINRLFSKGDKRRGDALVLGAMIFKELSSLLTQQREEARKEEAERWINQPANEHDNKIREEAVRGFIDSLSFNTYYDTEDLLSERETYLSSIGKETKE